MTDNKKQDQVEKAPRPSQAEGEAPGSGSRPGGARPEEGDAPRPSQAEGELEDEEEDQQERDAQKP